MGDRPAQHSWPVTQLKLTYVISARRGMIIQCICVCTHDDVTCKSLHVRDVTRNSLHMRDVICNSLHAQFSVISTMTHVICQTFMTGAENCTFGDLFFHRALNTLHISPGIPSSGYYEQAPRTLLCSAVLVDTSFQASPL